MTLEAREAVEKLRGREAAHQGERVDLEASAEGGRPGQHRLLGIVERVQPVAHHPTQRDRRVGLTAAQGARQLEHKERIALCLRVDALHVDAWETPGVRASRSRPARAARARSGASFVRAPTRGPRSRPTGCLRVLPHEQRKQGGCSFLPDCGRHSGARMPKPRLSTEGRRGSPGAEQLRSRVLAEAAGPHRRAGPCPH